MTTTTKPRATKPVPGPGLSHGDVMDLVTGGAATWANKRHATKTKGAHDSLKSGARAASARKPPASGVRLEVSIQKDLHQRLQAEAKRRKLSTRELLEQLIQAQIKR
jgi:predicted HicB family RNase H-like nuclease